MRDCIIDTEIPDLKPSEIYIEAVRVVKDNKFFTISIGRTILKKDWTDMAKALKAQLKAEQVYLNTIER